MSYKAKASISAIAFFLILIPVAKIFANQGSANVTTGVTVSRLSENLGSGVPVDDPKYAPAKTTRTALRSFAPERATMLVLGTVLASVASGVRRRRRTPQDKP